LEEIGVPRCPGKIMASSPRWRHSLSDWKQLVDLWVSSPTPEYVLNFGMFQDLRPLHGEETLGAELRDHILTTVHHNASFFPNMASHVVRFPSPFNLFGRVRVELGGEHRGKIDLKKAGIFAITTGTSLLALEAGIIGGNTWEKLERLHKRGIFSSGDFETIQKAFSFLTQLRLQRQLQELPAHGTSTYHIDPQTMTNKERDQLRQALNGVNTFLWIFRDQYNLNFMSY
jgi:CBS domain-containing protein